MKEEGYRVEKERIRGIGKKAREGIRSKYILHRYVNVGIKLLLCIINIC